MGKFIIYQVLPRLFGNTTSECVPGGTIDINGCGKFSDFDDCMLESIKELGCTYVWFTGIIEHSTKTDYSSYGIFKDYNQLVKGEAGSPYAIKDYYDVDPDLAGNVYNRFNEFKELIDRVHNAGMKVLIDFVPNHVARVYISDSKPDHIHDFGSADNPCYSFHPMNNFYYIQNESFKSPISSSYPSEIYYEFPAKVSGNDCFRSDPTINDWFETVKLNYGVDYKSGGICYFDPVPDTWNKMDDILNFWLMTGIDGFRCDMAEMVPIQFWHKVIPKAKQKFPESIFIAEVYNPSKYSDYLEFGSFDYLYDKVGLYDTLKMITLGNKSAEDITKCWQSLGSIQPRMLNFIENHDEVRAASDFYACDSFSAIPALTVSLMLNQSPFMIYFAQELGERGMDTEGFSSLDGKTSIYDYWALSSIKTWRSSKEEPDIRKIYRKLMSISTLEKAVSEGKNYDLQYMNPESDYYNPKLHYSFLRSFQNEIILIVVNFSNVDSLIKINIPKHAFEYFGIDRAITTTGFDLIDEVKVEEPLSTEIPYSLSVKKKWIRIIKFLLQ